MEKRGCTGNGETAAVEQIIKFKQKLRKKMLEVY